MRSGGPPTGLPVTIELMDYRELEGRFDKVVSVGMFEHVGEAKLGLYFQKAWALLCPGGLFMNHAIACPGSAARAQRQRNTFSNRYVFPDVEDGENVPDQIPASIKQLNGRNVSIRGFMLPVTQKDGNVTEFLLLKDQSLCCYGTMPQMNEWVHVIMKPGQSAPMVWDIPVTVFGTFEVGEVFENGVLMTIYRLRYEKLVKPELAK